MEDPMRKIALAAGLAGALFAAAPAFAGPGQCYNAYGRPVGPVYDTDRPNYRFLNSVMRRGGTCTGNVSPPNRPRYRGYEQPSRPYYYRGYRNHDGDRYRYYR